MSATGKDTTTATTPSFIAALVTAGITVGAFSALWLVLHGRRNLQRVFMPRAILAPESKRPRELPSGLFSFWTTVFKMPDQEIIVANGLDAYLFVRFLKVFGIQMLVPYFLLTFIILIPVSAASPNAGQTGLNKLTFGNVASNHQNRHIAHFFVALVLISWTLYLLWREYNHLVEVRQAWLASPQHQTLARTRTISITGLPEDVNSGSGLRELAGSIGRLTGGASQPRISTATENTTAPLTGNGNGHGGEGGEAGGVRSVWLARKIKPLEKIWEERDNECSRLEGGVAKLIKLGNKNYNKGKTPEQQGSVDTERGGATMTDRFVLSKKRPTWKQGPLGLFGKKMTLETSPVYIAEHSTQIDSLRSNLEQYEQGTTAFLRFSSQHEAHAFARLVTHTDKKYRMVETGIEVIPEDVVWSNTSMNPYQRKIRTIVSWALTIGLIIIWAVPVAFVGSVSNIDKLCTTASWLAWICTLPGAAKGIIKGVLPPVLLAVLFMLLPIVLRIWIKLQGEIRQSDIELKLFTRYWLFQVIHGFLIITLSSGLINALGNLSGTSSQVPTLLAQNLPGASIFFLTFVLTSTFSGAAKSYSRVVPFVMFLLKGILGGNTPRKVYLKAYKMDQFKWSTTWPPLCLIVCVTIVYSVIQPVITILALVAFCMLYAAYKYVLYWCADQPDSLETGGMYYVKALRTVFVSLYLEEICLAGLFFLSTDQDGNRAKSGLGCGAVMIVLIIATAILQTYIDWFRFPKDYIIYAHSTTSVAPSRAQKLLGTHQNKLALSQHQEPLEPVATTVSEEYETAGPEMGNTSGFHRHAFDHPAMWKKQPVVWIADDPLGIGKFECARIREAKVDASTEFATANAKGVPEVERGPPDEAWYGGFTSS